MDLSDDEREHRVSKLNARLSAANEVKTKLRKVNAFLTQVALENASKATRKAQIRAALRYVSKIDNIPTGVKASVVMVQNDLQSLVEGLTRGDLDPKHAILKNCVRAIKHIDDLSLVIQSNLKKLTAGDNELELSQEVKLLLKNKEAKEKIPPFNGKAFVIARAPVAFTFANKKHSSVGYLDKDVLDRLGFRSDNLGGYTILHNQLMIGIDALAVYDRQVDPETNTVDLKRQKVKESTIVFKKGNPTQVMKSKEVAHFDMAQNVMKLLQSKTGTKYAFMSERGVGLNGGEFFWIMPAADATLMHRAFPGGFNRIDRWGFAF